MKTQTKTVKGKYEAPECQAFIFAVHSKVLSVSLYSTESFDTSDDSENWD